MFLSSLLGHRADSGSEDGRWVAIDPQSGFAYSIGGGSPDAAMRCATVFECVRLLSEDIAKLPLIVYRRLPNGGKERAPNHPLYSLLKNSPNDWQTSFEFRQLVQARLELRGDGYAKIYPGRRGAVDRLEPLSSDGVTVSRNRNGKIIYQVMTIDGARETLTQDEIFHLRGFSINGLTGMSTIGMQAETIGVGLAGQKFQLSAFKNGVKLSGVFTHPGTLKDTARENLRNSIANHAGSDRAGGFMILEEGLVWKEMSMTLHDAQFLELRKLNRAEIAALFRVPPHKIGDLDKATFSNIEHQSLEYVTDGLMARIVRWEQAISRDLIIGPDQDIYFAEFLVDSLLRGDIKSRYDAYSVGINCGILNPNEARAFENMNPRPAGNGFWQPLNTSVVGAQAVRLEKMIRITGLKLANKELVALRKASAKYGGAAFIDWANEFYRGYRESLVESLQLPGEAADRYVNEGLTQLRAVDRFSDVLSEWESERAEKLVEIALAA